MDDKLDAKVKMLGECIDHHVEEERAEIFAKARAARKLDLVGMRETLTGRKEELLAKLTGASPDRCQGARIRSRSPDAPSAECHWLYPVPHVRRCGLLVYGNSSSYLILFPKPVRR